MAGVNSVAIKLSVTAKNIEKRLNKIKRKFQSTVGDLKNILLAAKIGSYLLSGANKVIEEYSARMRLIANLNEQGFGREFSENLFNLSNEFEKLGYSADQANDAFTQFITTGKASTLQSIGIYLDNNTKSMLATASAQERLNWILAQGNNKLKEQQQAMPESIRKMIELKKSGEDVQKALGQSFLGVLNGIINGLGGMGNALKTALAIFTVYKTAMIAGHIAIGFAKALSLGSVFALPVALAMAGAGIAAVTAMIGTSVVAGNAINSLNFDNNSTSNPTIEAPKININIERDRYGNVINERSGVDNGRIN